MSNESEVSQKVQIAAPKYGCILMRNNSGGFKDATGRFIRFGLGHTSSKQQFASSDLIGITKVVITPEMVGQTVGIFTALEVKNEEWTENKKLDDHEIKQNNFLLWVKNNGGIASFVSNVDRLASIFRR